MSTEITLGYLAAALGGAGLVQLDGDFNRAMILIGAAVVLIVVKAVLNKSGVPVASKKNK